MRHAIIGGNMKRFALALLLVGLVLSFTSAAMAYTGTYQPGQGINGTPHDLSLTNQGVHGMIYPPNPADPYNRICIFCHAPHNTYRLSTAAGGVGPQADPTFDYLPLWNHTLPDPVPTYTMYENGTGAPQNGPKASQAIINGMTPGSVSLLCLSCHDGSIAVNSWGNTDQISRSTGANFMVSTYEIGADQYLGNHHPIGFNYDDVFNADTEIRDPDAAMMTPTTYVRDHLFGQNGGTLECASCHSVHNKGNDGERLLWRSDQNSELCLTCHDKGLYTAP